MFNKLGSKEVSSTVEAEEAVEASVVPSAEKPVVEPKPPKPKSACACCAPPPNDTPPKILVRLIASVRHIRAQPVSLVLVGIRVQCRQVDTSEACARVHSTQFVTMSVSNLP